MLKRPSFIFKTISGKSKTPTISKIYTRRQIHNSSLNMADFEFTESSDLVSISQDLNVEDRDGRRSNRGGRGRGKGRVSRGGGGGGGGRGGKPVDREVLVSKALSKLLRHAAEDVGLALDEEGFARVDQVVSQRPPCSFMRLSLLSLDLVT